MKKNNGGKMKNGNKICPKCGKIHSGKCGSKMKKHQLGGIITAMQKFKNGGSLNGVPFMQSGNIVRYNPMVHGISMTKSKQQLIDEYNTRQDQINTHMPQPSPGIYNSQPTNETNGQMLARKAGEIVGNIIAPIRVPVKAAYNWLTSTSGTNIKNQQAYDNRNKNSYDIGKRFLGLKRGGSLKNKAIAKGQTGLVMNDPTYRTQEEVDRINAGNRNLARGLFKDLTSGNIAPSIQNIGRMVSAGYRGYLEPERVNKPLTGEPPAVSPSSSLFVKPSIINYVANPAERAARADFLKEAINKFEKTIAGSGKISKGVVDDWNYPRRILNKFKSATPIETPVVVTPTASGSGLNTIPKPAISSTSKLQDRKAGISGINRDKYRRAAAMETEDARHVNSGFRRVIRGQFDLAKDAIRNYPQYYDPYRRVEIKLNTVSDPKRLSELKKQERNILREFITKIGL